MTSRTKTILACLSALCVSAVAFADIPCDLNKVKAANGKLPPIWISGETHNDSQCREDQDHFKQAAYQGKIFLGLEGSYYNQPQAFYQNIWSNLIPIKTVFGLEDELVYPLSAYALDVGLVILGHLGGSTRFDTQEALRYRDVFLRTIVTSQAAKEIYKEMRKKGSEGPDVSPQEQELFREFDKFMLNPLDTGQETPLPASSDLKTFESVATRFAMNMARTAKAKHETDKRAPTGGEIIKFMEATLKWWSQGLLPAAEQEALAKDRSRVILEWRNVTFSDHLIEKYCEAAKENKPLYAVVGSDHSPGLIHLLKHALGRYEVEIAARSPKQAAMQLKELLAGKTENLKNIQKEYSVCPTVQVQLKQKGLIPSDTMCSVLIDKLNSAYDVCKKIIW